MYNPLGFRRTSNTYSVLKIIITADSCGKNCLNIRVDGIVGRSANNPKVHI
jgi:hypothetical protein